jgi:LmbE family N-acetylglucosaminyl deacetylase
MAVMVDVKPARPAGALFLSPHLDDAVFACGEVIASSANAVVATLFAGHPPVDAPHTVWDTECGFHAGDDIVGARRDEDRHALDVLQAQPVWLDYCDDQYGCSPDPQEIVDALAALLAQHAPAAVLFPLGLFHTDHRRTSDATLPLIARFEAIRWYVYEDAIYRRIPNLVEQRIALLHERGFALQSHSFPEESSTHARKCRAVACYRSQLEGLRNRPAHRDTIAPETFWRITRRSAAQ